MKTISEECAEMAARLDDEADRSRAAALEIAQANGDRLILAEYERAGLEPIRGGSGILVTLPMARKLGLQLKKVGRCEI
jgi:hypothetical protein